MVTKKITDQIKKSLVGFDALKMHDQMLRQYRLLHLIDDNERWMTPELQAVASDLLPADMTEERSRDFVDTMALLAERNPYLKGFLEQAQHTTFKNISKKVAGEGAQLLPDIVAYAQVLDRLTKATHDNPKILQQCVDIFKRERKQIKLFKHESLFRKIKLLSVEKPIVESIILQSYTTRMVRERAGHVAAFVNIMEATLADVIEGNIDNAKVGWILATHKPGSKKYNPRTGAGPSVWADDAKTILLRPPLPKEWADLYQTWNMAFVAQSQSFPYLIPKLLIPQVADYQDNPAQYLHKRVLALYICLNYLIFDCAKRMGNGTPAVRWDDEELANFWGRSNLESARIYERALIQVTHQP